ncbi:flagellar assembly protein FliH [Acidovorax sp. FJL06]|uniref:FliH/SctL family protein n=1 Tax=Acidovorax sp. FJL06 TaxID=2153365 RepID=UPI0018F422BC|nr:flagellar assembly protein FliH [Acidovorax sp. FJL06]
MMPSSNQRSYSRFIPSEEVGDFKQWKFSAVDGSDLVEPEPEPAPEISVEVDEAAAEQALQQQACDDAYAEGFAQGQAQTALEWQRRMDDYIAQQGQEAAQRVQAVLQTLDASLIDMQQQMAQQLLELACDIARQVVRQELSVNPNALQPVVREAVGMLVTEGRPAMVRLNPLDMEAMAQPLREELDGPGVQWVADAAVPAGGCLVESAGTVVDGSLDKRWQRAIAALGLESPWSGGEGDDR